MSLDLFFLQLDIRIQRRLLFRKLGPDRVGACSVRLWAMGPIVLTVVW